VEGMDVVDKIEAGDTDRNDRPRQDAVIERVTTAAQGG
jgi:cyclophilin family peptidyl-prolyl cis-trans isomerase